MTPCRYSRALSLSGQLDDARVSTADMIAKSDHPCERRRWVPSQGRYATPLQAVTQLRHEVARSECCDTRSHVVSVLVKEVWLMPET